MADINVFMTGGRRAGKTSVLAALDKCCNELLAAVPELCVSCKDGGVSLTLKENELKHYFGQKYRKRMIFTADLNNSSAPETYTYEVNVNNRDSGYTLKFMDFPGEYLLEADKQDELQKKMDMSQIIIIAIDTPHMVEDIEKATGVGEFHSEFNRDSEITRFFKKTFQAMGQQERQERMVLFVPLKCEKYYYRNKMDKVCRTLKKGYSELLNYLANDEIKQLCTVGIVPILTIGGAEFFKFDVKSYTGIYNYVEDISLRKYNPKYCEQPLFLILYYLIIMAERNKLKQNRASRWFRETFFNTAKLANLVICKDKLIELIEVDVHKGFEMVQNPLEDEINAVINIEEDGKRVEIIQNPLEMGGKING